VYYECRTSGEAVLSSTPRSLMSSSSRPSESSSRLLDPCCSLASSAASTLRICGELVEEGIGEGK
jgi:hypothetical protein